MTARSPLTWDRLALFACDKDIGEAALGLDRPRGVGRLGDLVRAGWNAEDKPMSPRLGCSGRQGVS